MKYFECIADGIDTTPLVAVLSRLDRSSGSNQQWKDRIWFSIATPPEWLDVDAVAIVADVLSRVRINSLESIALNILRPGGQAYPHIDHALTKGYAAKFHFVVTSEPACLFTAGDETVHMAPGELWWFNNLTTHSVINAGATDRAHIVFEATSPEYPRPVPRGSQALPEAAL